MKIGTALVCCVAIAAATTLILTGNGGAIAFIAALALFAFFMATV